MEYIGEAPQVRHLGFTGTRHGLSGQQAKALQSLLLGFAWGRGEGRSGECALHHGDCIGADVAAAQIARYLNIDTIAHPPIDESRRAFALSTETREPETYRARNEAIVKESEVLIAAPHQLWEEQRSGTWMTVRMARARSKPVFIIWPDGALTIEPGISALPREGE